MVFFSAISFKFVQKKYIIAARKRTNSWPAPKGCTAGSTEFYAYYQWYYNIPSAEVIKRVPIDFLKKAYYGLHDLELDLAVKKVGEES